MPRHSTRIPRTCQHCGKSFAVPPSKVQEGGGKFCSISCGVTHRNIARYADTAARFWSKVDRSGGADACWPWLGGHAHYGHGRFWLHGRRVHAHRVAYILTRGPIPDGLDILHTCDNPPCCNPAHHYPGTQIDNVRDRQERNRQARGERLPFTKLTGDQVLAIRARHAAGGITYEQLAAEYGVGPNAIRDVVLRNHWQHI
jgi:hypothetical protein